MKNSELDSFHIGVKALIRNPEGRILLLERHHPSKKIYWDIPGGRKQKGESVIDTLIREVKEETGYTDIMEFHPFSMVLSDIRIPTQDGNNVGLIFSIFFCDIPDSRNPILSSEHKHFSWFYPPAAAQKLNADYPKEFIGKLSQLTF